LSVFESENIHLDSTLQVSFEQKSDKLPKAFGLLGGKQVPSQAQIAEEVKKEFKLRGYSHNACYCSHLAP